MKIDESRPNGWKWTKFNGKGSRLVALINNNDGKNNQTIGKCLNFVRRYLKPP